MRLTLTVSPKTYQRATTTALAMLTLIVLTGAGVRLTGSGLGCPDWPRCYGNVTPPLEIHAIIEYGNRVLSGFVGISAIAAALLAFFRRPFRRDLAWLSLALPLGVVSQATLGAFTVMYHLAPGFVMGHYALSMVILTAAVALAWRSRYERPPVKNPDRAVVWGARGLLAFGAFTILVGTAATAAGPHAGGRGTGDTIHRLQWFGADTLDWAIGQHARLAAVLGVLTVAVWWWCRRRRVDSSVLRALLSSLALIAVQGVIGISQYLLHLPAELVWLHVALATLTWLTFLFVVVSASFLQRTQTRPDEGVSLIENRSSKLVPAAAPD